MRILILHYGKQHFPCREYPAAYEIVFPRFMKYYWFFYAQIQKLGNGQFFERVEKMIPKVIHYCWFGHNPLPKMAQKCIASWKQYCPDYEIVEWNESNYNITNAPLYVRQAYELKKWAFVSDYVRLQVVYENGGVYFDTDVELLKPIDVFLEYKGFFGFEGGKYINTGLGFGAEKGLSVLMEAMDDYKEISFIKNSGEPDLLSCAVRNTKAFLKHGLECDNSKQILDNGILILPKDYVCPVDFKTGDLHITNNTISIHWYTASWFSDTHLKKSEPRKKQIQREKRRDLFDRIVHFPNRLMIAVLGKEKYNALKNKLGR